MSERYWITGVQLGILRVLVNQDALKAMDILQSIEDKQFIGSVNEKRSVQLKEMK